MAIIRKNKPLVVIGAIVLLFLLTVSRLSFNVQTVISSDEILSEDNSPEILANLTTPPNKLPPLALYGFSTDKPQELVIRLKDDREFNGLEIFFPGNTHSCYSYAPSRFDLYTRNGNDEDWAKVDSKTNYNKSSYRYASNTSITTGAIKFVFHQSICSENNNYYVKYSDIHFFEQQKLKLIPFVAHLINSSRGSLISYWLYYLLLIPLLILPGYNFLYFFDKKRLIETENTGRPLFSMVFSLLIMVTLTILYLITGHDYFLYLYLPFCFSGLFIFLKNKYYQGQFKIKNKTGIFFILSLCLVFILNSRRDLMYNLDYHEKHPSHLSILDDGYLIGYFADNTLPWRIAKIFYYRVPLGDSNINTTLEGSTLFERTPLLPLIQPVIMRIFGDSHFIYQRMMEIFAALFVSGFYLWFKTRFSELKANFFTLLVLLNIPISFMPFNAEYFSKYLAMIPLLLALTLDYRKQSPWIIGILFAVSFCVHPFTLVIISSYFLFKIIKQIKNRQPLLEILPHIIPFVVLFSAWLIAPRIAAKIVPDIKTKSYITNDITTVNGNLVANKAINLVTLFTPNILLKGDRGDTLKINSAQYVRQFSRYSIITNLTPFVFFVFLFLVIKKRVPLDIFFLSVIPLFLYWFIYLNQYNYWYNYGAGYFHLYYFTVPIMLSITFNYLLTKGIKPLVLLLSYTLFMAVDLFLISNIHTKVIYASRYVQIAEYLIILSFVSLAVITIIYFQKIRHAR